MSLDNKINNEDKEKLLSLLKKRFEENMHRHSEVQWEAIESKLLKNDSKLWSIYQMEQTDGQPDVVGYDENTNEYLFFDCAKESPKGRRSLCYDHDAQVNRKKYPPENNVEDVAKEFGIQLLDESEYRYLQKLEQVDTKTSSWLLTPSEIRELGGAIFGDNRYNTVFIYHNGADSYYGARGFRASLRL